MSVPFSLSSHSFLLAQLKINAAACATALEAGKLCFGAPSLPQAVYIARWVELVGLEAPARTVTHHTDDEIFDFSFIVQDGNPGAWLVLSINEVTERALACTTAAEAKKLHQAVYPGSTDQAMFKALWVALANAEAKTMAPACKTEKEALLQYQAAPPESPAQKMYEARWMELHLEEK